MSRSEVNRPEARFSFGGCTASVFVNQVKRTDGSSFAVRKVVLQRTYVDSEGDYQATNSLGVNDLPKAVLSLQRAFEHCVSVKADGGGQEEQK